MSRGLLSILIGSVSVSSCLLPDYQPTQSKDFAEAVSVCRFQHTGRTNQKLALPASEEHIEECLARRGWLPSGEPLPPATQVP
jgi:hypothetical protein